jgi:hypothetical protein
VLQLIQDDADDSVNVQADRNPAILGATDDNTTSAKSIDAQLYALKAANL